MYFLTYVSSATVPFTRDRLNDLLRVCEANNRRDGITGMLLYKDGNFMQVIEGPEAAVRGTMFRMREDARHSGLIVLLEGPQQERQFPQWSMAYRDLSNASANPAGYSEFLNTPLTGDELTADPSRAQKLLMTFKQAM